MKWSLYAVSLFAWLVVAPAAFGHGFAGKRFFPATLNVEDSFVAPELDFLFAHNREDGDFVSELEAEFAKPLTANFQLSIGGSYIREHEPGGPTARGFSNVELGAKYQVFIDDAAESALAVGLEVEVGDTGNAEVGAESFSVISPAIYYSKGFGNVAAGWLRPFAVTAVVAPVFPAASNEPDMLEWGLTVQYSLPYLENFVRDTGLPAPFHNMIPVVEFPMETCLEGECSGETTGSVNPGVIWVGRYSQLGFEMVIPVNEPGGSHVGFQLQYHLYLDDIFPSWGLRGR